MNKKFNELITLQSEREEYEKQADRIQKSSPFCQLPQPFFEALDKAVEIGGAQAELWNNIRGFILKDNKTTLWQLAIKNNFPVKRFGQEEFFKLDSEQLNIIEVEIK